MDLFASDVFDYEEERKPTFKEFLKQLALKKYPKVRMYHLFGCLTDILTTKLKRIGSDFLYLLSHRSVDFWVAVWIWLLTVLFLWFLLLPFLRTKNDSSV